MKDFKLDDIIRYFITGSWIYYLLYQNDIIIDVVGKEFVFVIVTFSLGALSYTIFRTAIYPYLIQMLIIEKLFYKDTGRKYIETKFGIESWRVKNDIWVMFHQYHEKVFPGHYSIWLSSFLTLFVLSISTLIAGLFEIKYCSVLAFQYLGASALLFAVGLLGNVNYEKRFFNNAILALPEFDIFINNYINHKIKAK